MTKPNDIPREGPADDDGSGLPFVITYAGYDDDRVPCPECAGAGVKLLRQGGARYEVACAVCDGRKRVSPLFASTWLRQGV